MPTIRVALVVTTEDGVLLVREAGADAWSLPGGPLLDTDETVEAAALREVARLTGSRPEWEPEFLDTLYERDRAGEVTLHNLYHLPIASSALLGVYADELARLPEARPSSLSMYADGLYRQPADLASLPPPPIMPPWLRDGLVALFSDEEAALPFDLAELQRALGGAPPLPPVIIVTGPAGAGKTTVAVELCRRYERAAHVSADLLRDMVVSGYASPVPGRSDPEEAAAQNRLVTENSAALARNFTHAGMVVVIDEVLETREGLDDLLEALGPDQDVRFVTLLPSAEELARRDALRGPADQMGARSEELRGIVAANGETRGIRLDSSGWSVEETVDIILERLGEARVAAPDPSPTSWERGA